jgi:threonine 3-dehydrogenase
MQTMKALVKKRAEAGLVLCDVPLPEVGINDVLIKIEKTSICGTDVHIYDWDVWAQQTLEPPVTIGHEFVGHVAEVGGNVRDFRPGDLVSGEGHVVCGHCRNCLAGRRHLCADTSGVGIHRNGAFAEYLSLPASNVWQCDPNIATDIISCFDPMGNAVHTALSFDILGEDVLITGAGPIGIMAAAVAKHVGARHVVITDVNPYRLELAKKIGVSLTIDVTQEKLEDVEKRLGMKEGFDVGLEMSGNAAALRSMLSVMCHGGKIAMLGIQQPGVDIDWNTVVFNGLTIKGIYGRQMYETWYKMTSMIQTGLDISPLITHRLPYQSFEEGFAIMRSGQSGKVVLNWSE